MMAHTPESVLATLKKFSHARMSNISKGKLSNHDAAAYIFFCLGVTKAIVVKDILMSWRNGGKPNWKRQPVRDWSSSRQAYIDTGKSTKVPAGFHFTYLFNNTVAQGYGFVGKSATSRCNKVTWYNYHSKGDVNHGVCERRTYWFRTSHGVYAPTLECVKRMAEMRAFFDL